VTDRRRVLGVHVHRPYVAFALESVLYVSLESVWPEGMACRARGLNGRCLRVL